MVADSDSYLGGVQVGVVVTVGVDGVGGGATGWVCDMSVSPTSSFRLLSRSARRVSRRGPQATVICAGFWFAWRSSSRPPPSPDGAEPAGGLIPTSGGISGGPAVTNAGSTWLATTIRPRSATPTNAHWPFTRISFMPSKSFLKPNLSPLSWPPEASFRVGSRYGKRSIRSPRIDRIAHESRDRYCCSPFV